MKSGKTREESETMNYSRNLAQDTLVFAIKCSDNVRRDKGKGSVVGCTMCETGTMKSFGKRDRSGIYNNWNLGNMVT